MSRRRGRASQQRQHDLESKIPGSPVTPEYRQHHSVKNEVIAEDKAGYATIVRQTVRTKFLALHDDGVLTKAEMTAALLLRTYADSYYRGVVGPYQIKVDGSSRPGEGMTMRLEYAQKVNGALRYLNSELRKVAIAYILEGVVPGLGHTFTSIGASYYPNMRNEDYKRMAGKTLVIATCRELAIHFKQANAFDFDVTQGVTGVRFGKIRAKRAPEAV